jgi:glutamine amidotransferase
MSLRAEPAHLVVLDYGIGNLRSAYNALQRVGARVSAWQEPGTLKGVDGVVLPGVGSFGPCADALSESRLVETARQAISSGIAFLGICVGFQLLYEASQENPTSSGLGIFAGTVASLPRGVKHPQMQWNRVENVGQSSPALLVGIDEEPWVYFVHSYAPPIGEETVSVCTYGGPIAAMAERDNVFGTQFHPEKSGEIGLAILSNFVARAKGEF